MINLTQEQVAELADKYGFAANSKDVVECAQIADAAHGKNIGRISWQTDVRCCVVAYKLLDGLLDQVLMEMENANHRRKPMTVKPKLHRCCELCGQRIGL